MKYAKVIAKTENGSQLQVEGLKRDQSLVRNLYSASRIRTQTLSSTPFSSSIAFKIKLAILGSKRIAISDNTKIKITRRKENQNPKLGR